jgi:periplasmic mercuric ion binding protein
MQPLVSDASAQASTTLLAATPHRMPRRSPDPRGERKRCSTRRLLDLHPLVRRPIETRMIRTLTVTLAALFVMVALSASPAGAGPGCDADHAAAAESACSADAGAAAGTACGAAASAADTGSAAGHATANDKVYVLGIEGMSCPISCPPEVKKSLEGVEGVRSVEVSFEDKRAVVHTDPGVELTVEQLDKSFHNMGYFVSSLETPQGN